MKRTIYIIGGVLHLLFAAFHAFFHKMFDWKETLSTLSPTNRGIMVVLNNCAVVLFLGIALLSFFFAKELADTKVGRAVSVFVAAFFLIRAIEEPIYFGMQYAGDIVIFGLCTLVGIMYLVPLFISEKQPVHSVA
jgi:hypothetical protein